MLVAPVFKAITITTSSGLTEWSSGAFLRPPHRLLGRTSSARASTVGGTSRPSALAVRLTTTYAGLAQSDAEWQKSVAGFPALATYCTLRLANLRRWVSGFCDFTGSGVSRIKDLGSAHG
jgi:hypothetical protein